MECFVLTGAEGGKQVETTGLKQVEKKDYYYSTTTLGRINRINNDPAKKRRVFPPVAGGNT